MPATSLRPGRPLGLALPAVARAAGAAPAGPAAGDGHDLGAITVTGVTLRAQQARPGDLFAALPGTATHGARFAADAVAAGAVAVLTDPAGMKLLSEAALTVPALVAADVRAVLGAVAAAVHHDPSAALQVIGITGTSGKTTTCYLVEGALRAAGIRSALIGTVQTRIDGVATPSALTTPEAPDLQALFALMVEAGVAAVAMEVSSHALQLGRVAGTRFAVGGFSNLSQDHLDFHHDMESYFRAKSLLFDGRSRRAVITVDDEWGRRLADRHPDAMTVSTAGDRADWSVRSRRPGPAGAQDFELADPGGIVHAGRIGLPGPYNVANAALAVACVVAAGIGVEVGDAVRGLASVTVPGRMERIEAGQDFLAVVDYAHKPAALAAVLQALAVGLTGRLILVLGAGGDRDTGKRAAMGANAAALADLVIVTDDNPRTEPPERIRAALLAGAVRDAGSRRRPGTATVVEIGDRRSAIRAGVAAARTGDVLLVAGKGHEQGQEIGGVVHPFSDRAELLAALTADAPADRPA